MSIFRHARLRVASGNGALSHATKTTLEKKTKSGASDIILKKSKISKGALNGVLQNALRGPADG